jgi:hypothetical protein
MQHLNGSSPRRKQPMAKGFKLMAVGASVLALGLGARIAMAQPNAPEHAASATTRARVVANYGKLPISFEPNVGQVTGGSGARDVKFLSRGNGYTLFLDPSESIVRLHREAAPAHKQKGVKQLAARQPKGGANSASEIVDMKLVGANATPKAIGFDGLPGKVNYIRGRDPKNWHTDIPTYAKVKLEQVYPGIDLVYYGNQQQLEYDFVVQPGADPRAIRMDVAGLSAGKAGTQTAHAVAPRIDRNGDLVVAADNSELRFHKPVVYQPDGGSARKPVDGEFKLDKGQVTFQVASYDRSRPLVIDPVLAYSTYINNTAVDETWAQIAVDSSGNAYVGSETDTTDIPTANPYQANHDSGGDSDATLFKLNPAGTALVYATYLGGTNEEASQAMAVDAAGEAIMAGYTCSSDFPVTAGAYQTTLTASGVNFACSIFLTKFSASGSSLIGSTYLGGSISDYPEAIALDSSGNVYISGLSDSPDFPVTPGVVQTTFAGAEPDGPGEGFVAKLNPTLTSLTYATYLGGNSQPSLDGIAVDAAGDAYVAGYATAPGFPTTPGAFQTTAPGSGAFDSVVAKLNPTATALLYSTYVSAGNDGALGVAIDKRGAAYLTGEAAESNFPVTRGAFQTVYGGAGAFDFGDGYVAKLNPKGSALVYATYLGGSGDDETDSIVVDSTGGAWVTGVTDSSNFPVTPNAIQSTFAGPPIGANFAADAFVVRLNPKGSALTFSTYLGGSGDDEADGIALAPGFGVYVSGTTTSTDYPTTVGAFNSTCAGDDCGAYQVFVSRIWPLSNATASKRERARVIRSHGSANPSDSQAADPDFGVHPGRK